MSDKQILVIPREYIASLKIGDHEVKRVVVGHLHSIIMDRGMWLEREEAEHDKRYKQIIPYIMVRRPLYVPPLEGGVPPEVLSYARTEKSGEARLITKRSVGFGGHIKQEEGRTYLGALLAGMRREIEEELKFPDGMECTDPQFYGLINDDTNDVGQVHIGLLHVIDVKETKHIKKEQITTPDESIADLKWAQPITFNLVEFETWSQLAINALFPRKAA